MILDDLECQNRVFWKWIFGDFGLRDTFYERNAPKTLEIDTGNFVSPSLDFLGSRKPAHKGIKEQYSHERHYSFFMKTVADRHGDAAYHIKHH